MNQGLGTLNIGREFQVVSAATWNDWQPKTH